MLCSHVVAPSLLLLLFAPPLVSADRTIRLKAAGDEHHHHHSNDGARAHLPAVEDLPYCVADPHEHLHWTIVGGVITALLVALIYVHQQYASMQYQHALLVRLYRSRATRDDEDLDAIRKELRGRRMSARLAEYLDRKKKEMTTDDVKTARDAVPSSARHEPARSRKRSVRRVHATEQQRAAVPLEMPSNDLIRSTLPKDREAPSSDPPPSLQPHSD